MTLINQETVGPLINRSHRSNETIQGLIEFVTSHSRYSQYAKTLIKTLAGSRFTQGKAYNYNPYLPDDAQDGKFPCLVELRLSNGASYPRTSQLQEGFPVVQVNSWEEEFVFVCAHEFKHIEQFMTGVYTEMDKDIAELDAECFAINVLELYRRSKRGTNV